MKTVSQLNSLLSPYLGTGAQTSATTTLAALNAVLPRLMSMGDWKALRTPETYNVASGRFSLPPWQECVLTASLNGIPISINDVEYTTKYGLPGEITRPCGWDFGIIDNGYKALMEEPPTDGIEYLEFTSQTGAAFASGDTVTVNYDDTEDGYTQVVLALPTVSTSISGAATYSSGTETLLTVTASTGILVNYGVTISGASVSAYDGDWRVTAVPDATHIAINKTFVAGAVTGTVATNRKIEPANGITNVQPMVYSSLPSYVDVTSGTGDDEVTYAILSPGDGVASFHRYEVPQVPDDPADPDDWEVIAVVKRAFVPLTANGDIVYLDNIPALTAAFLAVVARDASDHEREALLWSNARAELDRELHDNKGGTKVLPIINIWGDGMPGLCNLNTGGGYW